MVSRVLGAELRQGDFAGAGDGGPLADLELIARAFTGVGTSIDLLDLPAIAKALFDVRGRMARIEDYWERGPGRGASDTGPIHHNLAVWGFEVLDALTLSDGVCARNTKRPKNNLLSQIPEMGMYRTAQRVLNPSQTFSLTELTQLDLARQLAKEAKNEKIEDLMIALGANNALATCLFLKLRWSQSADFRKLPHQRAVTIWEPEHFIKIYERIVEQVRTIPADRVYLATVPHVTIAPVTRGVTPRAKQRSVPELHRFPGETRAYYEYYTRFWTWDDAFNPDRDDHITREDARNVDKAIDEYNAYIHDSARTHGWKVIDMCKTLDDLAFRSTEGRPSYQYPPGLIEALKNNPKTSFRVRPDGCLLLDARFLRIPEQAPSADAPSEVWQRAYRGGLFGLDGVHPTTIGYGIVAHEMLTAMREAKAPGADPAALPWTEIVAADTLVTDPPPILASLEQTLSYLFDELGLKAVIERLAGTGSQPAL